jgi:hypothetical protein
MKPHRLTTCTRILLIAAIAGVMTACASAPHHYQPDPYYSPHAVYYDYWYYPAIDCYYDPRTRIYIYHEQDQWIRTRALPSHVRPYLGHHVSVRSPHQRPYERNHRHRQQYLPERYTKRDPAHRRDHAWIGAPRQSSPPRDRDDRRPESSVRNRNGKGRGHGPERGAIPVPPHYRGTDVKYSRQAPSNRPKNAPGQREPTASTVPIKRQDKRRQPENRREESHEQHRSGDARHNNGRNIGHGRSGSSTGQSRRYRAPNSRGQPPKTQHQPAPRHREPPAKTVPTKQDDKGHHREIRKQDTRHRYRKANDRRGNGYNNHAATSQRRQPSPYD